MGDEVRELIKMSEREGATGSSRIPSRRWNAGTAEFAMARPGATYPPMPRASSSDKSRSLQYPASASTVSGCASKVSFTSSSNPTIVPWSLAFGPSSVATIN